MRRVVFAAVTLCALTAFAPAPPPRDDRPGREGPLNLKAIQGVWLPVGLEEAQADGSLQRLSWTVKRVYVRGEAWGFDRDGGGFYVTVNARKNPPTIDFRTEPNQTDRTVMTGVLRLEDDTLRMAYVFTQPDTRPTSFGKLRKGDRVMTLKRVP